MNVTFNAFPDKINKSSFKTKTMHSSYQHKIPQKDKWLKIHYMEVGSPPELAAVISKSVVSPGFLIDHVTWFLSELEN